MSIQCVFLAPCTNPYSYMVTVNFSIRETIILCFTFEYAGLSTNYPSDLNFQTFIKERLYI